MPPHTPHSTSRVPSPSSPIARVVARIDAAGAAGPRDADLVTSDTIATGFPSVDRLLGGGVRAGDLVVIAGDVGSGKSAFALASALRAAQREAHGVVAFLSGEMAVERVAERVLAIEGRARVDDLRQGALDDAARAAVGAAALRLRDSGLEFERLPAGSVEALGDQLRRTLDLRLAVVDPIEALAAGARAREEEMATATARLKELALELAIPIVVTAQLPALSRDRADPRPRLHDLGALGALEQHADVVLALFREEMYTSQPGVDGAAELLVLKNRNGATGYADLYFYKQWMRFEDVGE